MRNGSLSLLHISLSKISQSYLVLPHNTTQRGFCVAGGWGKRCVWDPQLLRAGLSSLDTRPAGASGPRSVQQGLAPQWSLHFEPVTGNSACHGRFSDIPSSLLGAQWTGLWGPKKTFRQMCALLPGGQTGGHLQCVRHRSTCGGSIPSILSVELAVPRSLRLTGSSTPRE